MFASWGEFVDERKYARVILTKVLARLLNSALGRYFHHWNNRLREEAAKRAIGAPSHGAAHAPREIRGVRSAIVPELLRSPANARGADE